MSTRSRGLLAAAGLLACIVAANVTLDHLGFWHIGPFAIASGVIWAGLALTLRDGVQDTLGAWPVPFLIAAGAAVSYVAAGPEIAVASCAAFALGEGLDFAVYTPLRRRGLIRAVLASNLVGGVADSWLFLALAPFPWTAKDVVGLALAKLVVTAATLAVIGAVGARRRQPAA